MNINIIKLGKIFIFLSIFYIPVSSASLVNETYYEVTIPSAWFENYTKQRMLSLLKEFNKTDSHKKIFTELKKLPKKPKLFVDLYKDKVEGEINLTWVLRFTISTSEVGLKRSKEIVKNIGSGFGEYIGRYRKK